MNEYKIRGMKMNENNNNTTAGGISVCGLLGVAFVVLKLCKVINWSWWWVTAPFWGGFALVVVIFVVILVVAAIKGIGGH